MAENTTLKIPVIAIFDSKNETWDILDLKFNCLCYGSVLEIEAWLKDHSDTHEEIPYY